MRDLHIIPGAIGARDARALLLAPAGVQPDVVVREVGGPTRAADVSPQPLSARLAARFPDVSFFRCRVDGLEPGREHRWMARADASGTAEAAFRSFDPGARRLDLVVASCYYDGFHRSMDYLSTLRSPRCRTADFKLLIGDNLYLDVDPRQRDPAFDDPWKLTAAIYRRYFLESGYRFVLSQLPTFTTWDDHEYWNNFPEEVKFLSRTRSARLRRDWTEAGTDALDAFQSVLNPEDDSTPGRSYTIETAPVVSIFVADTRTDRKRRRSAASEMMPEGALERLESWCAELKRPGMLVLGQPLGIDEGGRLTDFNPPDYRDQYERIWAALRAAPFDVLVVSGDVHHSRALEIDLGGRRMVYEFVSSPACHIPTESAIATGGFEGGAQDRGEVGFPESLRPGGGARLVPRYLMGTSAPNSIGRLALRGLASGSALVDMTFLDVTRPGSVAAPANANVGFFGGGTRPRFSTCDVQHAFTLRKRS